MERHNTDSSTRELEWIQKYGSGTLRRCVEEDFAWRELYLEERTAFEFGYGFRPLLASRTTTGQPIAEGDNKAITETCWWARALRFRFRAKPLFTVQVVHLTYTNETREEGLGIIINHNEEWFPKGRICAAFTTLNGKSVNPC